MDHRRIRALAEELKNEIDRDCVSVETCFNLFRTLKALTMAHAKGKEFALYALFENSAARSFQDLQHYSLEGYERHDLMDFLMKEMGQVEEITPQWRAQLEVLMEFLEAHLKKEESDFFVRVRKLIDDDELKDLAKIYVRERDEIFAKKLSARPHPAQVFAH